MNPLRPNPIKLDDSSVSGSPSLIGIRATQRYHIVGPHGILPYPTIAPPVAHRTSACTNPNLRQCRDFT